MLGNPCTLTTNLFDVVLQYQQSFVCFIKQIHTVMDQFIVPSLVIMCSLLRILYKLMKIWDHKRISLKAEMPWGKRFPRKLLANVNQYFHEFATDSYMYET